MPRYKLTIEYDGTAFYGWQKQQGLLTVQQCIEEAVEMLCGSKVEVYGSGRTDKAVHAFGQVAHIDLPRAYALHKIEGALNIYLLAHPITIGKVEEVSDDFHARFSAKQRYYLYRIFHRFSPHALEHLRAWHIKHALDVEAMQAAATMLCGTHDFTSFRSTECQAASPIRTLNTFAVSKTNEHIIECNLSARSFLHHQVRIMVGSIVQVGAGRWTLDDLAKALEDKKRECAGPTAPAHGLYFNAVTY